MDFAYFRTVYLADTDAAGVVYFAKGMSICHEAYEEWLAFINISIRDLIRKQQIALPIIHSSIDFFAPTFCGDRLIVKLQVQITKTSEFVVNYQIFHATKPDKLVIKAITKHVAINPQQRSRVDLPEAITKNNQLL